MYYAPHGDSKTYFYRLWAVNLSNLQKRKEKKENIKEVSFFQLTSVKKIKGYKLGFLV